MIPKQRAAWHGWWPAPPLFVDPYAENRATGAFIIIDESSNNTVGAGMIL